MFATSKEALQAAIDASDSIDDDERDSTLLVALRTTTVDTSVDISATSTVVGKKRKTTKLKTKINVNAAFSGWGCAGPLIKLHELAVHIRISTIHHDRWIKIVGRDIGIDNATRWNSWYMVIDKVLTKQAEIMQFLQTYRIDLPLTLDSEDWDLLRDTYAFLQPFYQATMRGQDAKASLDQSLAAMDILLLHFEDSKV